MKSFIHFDLKPYNSYRVSALCDNVYFPDSESDLRLLFQKKESKIYLLGSGHNIILKRKQYRDDFVIFSGNFNRVEIDNGVIIAEAGATMLQLSELALRHSLTGLEVFFDIPSSVGGAIVMNAGASGDEIKDYVAKVRYFDPDQDIFKELIGDEITFSYRDSYFQRNPRYIVSKVFIQLQTGVQESIKGKMNSIKQQRWHKQPRDYPNAGSVFKRPKGMYVGKMIEDLGLKGLSVGGAQISRKHAGFIINSGNATGEDIIKLIEMIQIEVYKAFGVALEVEQRIIK